MSLHKSKYCQHGAPLHVQIIQGSESTTHLISAVISRLFGQQYVDVSAGQLGVHIVRVTLHHKTTTLMLIRQHIYCRHSARTRDVPLHQKQNF